MVVLFSFRFQGKIRYKVGGKQTSECQVEVVDESVTETNWTDDDDLIKIGLSARLKSEFVVLTIIPFTTRTIGYVDCV